MSVTKKIEKLRIRRTEQQKASHERYARLETSKKAFFKPVYEASIKIKDRYSDLLDAEINETAIRIGIKEDDVWVKHIHLECINEKRKEGGTIYGKDFVVRIKDDVQRNKETEYYYGPESGSLGRSHFQHIDKGADDAIDYLVNYVALDLL